MCCHKIDSENSKKIDRIIALMTPKNMNSPNGKKDKKTRLRKKRDDDSSSSESEWESETDTSCSEEEIRKSTRGKKDEEYDKSEFKKFISRLFPSSYSKKKAEEEE